MVNWVRPSSLRHSSVVLNIAVYEKRRRRKEEIKEVNINYEMYFLYVIHILYM